MKKAIIGGTGVYEGGAPLRQEQVETAFGTVEVDVVALPSGEEVAFLARHGKGHSVPPHRINYRANLKALQQLGVEQVLATAAVGSLNANLPSGTLVLVEDFLDATRQRPLTFFEGEDGNVQHVGMEEPYCPGLRAQVLSQARRSGEHVAESGVYVCTEGPRFETAAEIRMYRNWGADVVGMTNVPEVVLARELGLCYATLCLVVNMATGMEKSPITSEEINRVLGDCRDRATRLFLNTLAQPDPPRTCGCGRAAMKL